jgi:hypothetical protein
MDSGRLFVIVLRSVKTLLRGSVKALERALSSPDVELTAKEAASTFFRFFRSKHVVDFRFIIATAIILLVILIILVIVAGFIDAKTSSRFLTSEFIKFVFTYFGSAFTICGAIVAWAYLSASARLGIVDLFACEISTLCRVGSIFDIGKHYVDQYDTSPSENRGVTGKRAAGSAEFVSVEEYFPVFDNNSRDLQLLEASVVNNITAFYTFMKATRDAQRRLAQTIPSQSAKTSMGMPGGKTEQDFWHIAICNVIYMLFLGFESGRMAIEDLIEFEPAAAENKMVILLTELKCYSILCKHFQHDELRHARLQMREPHYKKEVPDLCRKVNSSHGENDEYWIPAKNTAPELGKRYKDTFGEDMDAAIFRRESEGKTEGTKG